MPVTKYDLALIANNFFVWSLTTPKHPVTPDACDQFAYHCYSLIVAIPSDNNAYSQLLHYLKSSADYYGIDVKKAVEYFRAVPGMQQMFLQYIKDNYAIETNTEILKRLMSDVFKGIGEVIAGSLWSLIKPLIPLFILVLIGIHATNRVSRSS